MEATFTSKAEPLSLDIITTLPQVIIETILCLLPIEDAARTSILSREWRYKWTKIPNLAFFWSKEADVFLWSRVEEENAITKVERERRNKDARCKLFCSIHQVLLQRQGPIHEFTLSMNGSDPTCVEIDQIILHLSRNHALKKLKLDFNAFDSDKLYGLPLSVFSLNHLTDLYLDNCDVNFKPIFNGFGSLINLTLKRIWISEEALLHLLSNCPSIKRLCLMLEGYADCDENPIVDLFKFLPSIEHLTTWGYLNTVDVDYAQEEFPASLIHLKYFCIEDLCVDKYGLTFLGVLTKCSPNLEKIKLRVDVSDELDSDQMKEFSVILEKYSDVWLEHLNELEILFLVYEELEVMFFNFILARSPNLSKVVLYSPRVDDRDEELEMLETLFSAPRPPNAPPVKIILKTQRRFEAFRSFDDQD